MGMREREREHETEMLLSVQDEEKKKRPEIFGEVGIGRGGGLASSLLISYRKTWRLFPKNDSAIVPLWLCF